MPIDHTTHRSLRAAARHAVGHIEVADGEPFDMATEDDYADAASNVWEPVLREVLDMVGQVRIDRARLAEIRAALDA